MLDKLKWALIGLLALLVLVSGFLMKRRAGQSAADWRAAQYCQASYGRARTRIDSWVVDEQIPVLSRRGAGVALSCGAMRKQVS